MERKAPIRDLPVAGTKRTSVSAMRREMAVMFSGLTRLSEERRVPSCGVAEPATDVICLVGPMR